MGDPPPSRTKPSCLSYTRTVCSEVAGAPVSIYKNMAHLSHLLGFKFVATCIITYGLQQGLSNSWFFQARDYYFKDHLMLEPAVAQTYAAVSMIPWSMKPLYGMASDFIPVMGYHRIPYICLAGFLSTLTLTLLFLLPLSAKLAVVLLFIANLSVATPDVMIDGIIAEKTKNHPQHSSDLQSLLWGSLSLFAILGYLTSGLLISTLGPKNVFGVITFVGVLIFISGIRNWVNEKKRVYAALSTDSAHGEGGDASFESGARYNASNNLRTYCGCVHIDMDYVEKFRKLLYLAVFLSVLALFLGALVLIFDQFEARVTAVAVIGVLVITSVLYMTRNEYSVVGKTALFLFSVQALSPDIDTAMFYWYTNYEGGPQFTPRFIGFISAFSFGAMFVGILIFNRYLGGWQFRHTFYCFLSLAAALVVPDMIIIHRWNIQVGVSDKLLVFGEAAIAPIIRRCILMPMFIIMAKVCPVGAEATVFAMLTALSNFGAAVSSYFGATLLVIFDVHSGNYGNLKWLLIVKTACRLSTLLLIPILVPTGCPNDDSSTKSSTEDESGVWGANADSMNGNDSRHRMAARASAASSGHGLLDSFHDKKDHSEEIGTDASQPARNPLHADIFQGARVLQLRQKDGTNSYRAPADRLDDQVVVRTKIDTSRYFQYISPHENLTTQNV